MTSNPKIEQPEDWLDMIHTASHNLRVIYYDLYSLSVSFHSTGNEYVGNLLKDYSMAIEESLKLISDGVGINLTESNRKAQEINAGLLRLVLTKELKDIKST